MRIFLFILFIPVLAALSLDITINFFPDASFLEPYNVQVHKESLIALADTGWVYETFLPSYLDSLQASTAPQTFNQYVVPVLQLPNLLISAVPFILVLTIYVIYLLVKNGFYLHHFGRCSHKEDFAVYRHAKSNAMKFKRK